MASLLEDSDRDDVIRQTGQVRYEDGSEELYDHHADPDEWTNLADKPEHSTTKRKLSQMIPKNQHAGLKVQDWFDKYQK